MEKLISHRSNLQSVPQLYILPPETRPGNTQVLIFETIPVIDFLQLGTDRAELIKQVTRAAQEFGFFQVDLRSFSFLHFCLQALFDLLFI